MMFAMILWFSSGSGNGVSSIHQEFETSSMCLDALHEADTQINRNRQLGAPYAGGMCVQIRNGNDK